MKTQTTTNHSRKRGSALISAIIFSAIASILLVSYVSLANMEHRNSMRSYLYSSSLNLAEAGIEYGVNALVNGTAASHTEWVDSATNLFTDGRFGGDVKVVILDANTTNPIIYSEGRMKGHPAGDVVKQVRAEIVKGFFPFEMGFAAKNGITMSGNNILLDSYNSNYTGYGESLIGTSAPSGWGVSNENKNDEISVASDSVSVTADSDIISQGNADIYGYVAVSPGSTVSIGPNGSVSSYGGSHDESRIEYDFYSDYPVLVPDATSAKDISDITSGETLPLSGDSGDVTYRLTNIKLNGNNSDLVIEEGRNVTLVITGDMRVSTSVIVEEGATLQIYADGDVDIGGNGILNTNGVPSDVMVFGTQDATQSGGEYSSSQTIKIAGNGSLSAAVYAPGADVELKGGGSGNNGDIYGAVVGFTATVTGNSSFHFDEALLDYDPEVGELEIESWLEMTSVSVASTPIDMSAYSDTE